MCVCGGGEQEGEGLQLSIISFPLLFTLKPLHTVGMGGIGDGVGRR